MSRVRMIGVAALIAAGMALPALASTAIGSVTLTNRMPLEAPQVVLKGDMATVQLAAEASDVRCASVVATSADGFDRTVFVGELAKDSPKTVNLNVAHVTKLTFNCRADGNPSASVDVMPSV